MSSIRQMILTNTFLQQHKKLNSERCGKIMSEEYVNYLSKLLLIFENVRRNAAEEVDSIYNVSFKINGDVQKWGRSLGLRFNHVEIAKAGTFINHLVNECHLAGELYHVVEYISISSCFRIDKISHRKTLIPEKRNIYVTVNPGTNTKVYEDLQGILTGVVDNYHSIVLLINGLERLREREVKSDG